MPFIAITVTVPNEVVSTSRIRQAIIDAQNDLTGPKLIGLFQKTTTGWDNEPDFISKRIDTASQLGIYVYPSGQYADQYALVNEGAKPHLIRPKRARMLRFQRGYRAATIPRVLSSRAKERSGPVVGAHVVHHPGFEPRKFTETIADTHKDEFERDMQEAIRGATT